MLTLIGLGLFNENDISLRAVEEAKNSDRIYIELYTSKWYGNLKNLEKILGREITELKRKDLEENSNKILEEAKNKKVIIFVQGDPLIQTTHSSLLMEAKKLGIKSKVIHNASILSAIAETGLHAQKFGPYVTIPFPEKTKGKLPESVFNVIRENKKRELHTLCLLDVIAEENKFMTVKQGLEILLKGNVVTKENKIVVFTKAGSDSSKIAYNSVDGLIKTDILDIPAVIIIPGKLHFTEKEYLEKNKAA
ncbi:MAG: diphthine synthase [Candidatus Aenigmarchaeota archaeon]|nr:diphthine synthase [Candidatus Aenigmarchaeota archaeon]